MEDEEGEFNFREILLARSALLKQNICEIFSGNNCLQHWMNCRKNKKQVFVWNELEDISFNEISERTGEKINTLISRKRYAVLHLRKRLEQLRKEIIEP